LHLCLITDRPAHPVVGAAIDGLRRSHRVRIIDPDGSDDLPGALRSEIRDLADVYLLRSHSRTSCDFALQLERAGSLLINGPAATRACRDRLATYKAARSAHLPWPETFTTVDLEAYVADPRRSRRLHYPLVVKSRRSYRGDVVRKVTSRQDVHALAATCPRESFIVQSYLSNDGRDWKLYVADGLVFGVCCPSPLSGGDPADRMPIRVPPAWAILARKVGRAFGLRVYGVDLVLSASGPVIVDVNAFPGFRGVPGGAQALIGMINRIAVDRKASP
jgi:ribosomal protein S6--L-glutamate ligase